MTRDLVCPRIYNCPAPNRIGKQCFNYYEICHEYQKEMKLERKSQQYPDYIGIGAVCSLEFLRRGQDVRR